MENVVTKLEVRCVRAGTNLTKLCEKAGIDRDLLTRWKKEEPKSFRILRTLEEALNEIETEAIK